MAQPFDFEEITRPDASHGLGELYDSDPLAMLGKVAASTARTERAVREFKGRIEDLEKRLRDFLAEQHAEALANAKRRERYIVVAIALFEAADRILHQAGVLK